jgi:Na+/glutamate symporter
MTILSNDLIRRPTIFAAIVAAAATIGVAVAGAIGGIISSYFQTESDHSKLQTTILVEIMKGNEQQRTDEARLMIQSGVLEDKHGAICMAFIGKDCPLKVLRPN